MPEQRLTAEQVIQAIQELGIEPAAAYKLIEITYMTPQEEMAKVKQFLQQQGKGGGQEQAQGGQPSEEQIIAAVTEMIEKGVPDQQIMGELQKLGASPEEAQQLIAMVRQQISGGAPPQGTAEESQPRV